MQSIGPGCRYLEIGCQTDVCFNAIVADEKIGVDPFSGGTIRATSDQFFASNRETFDVIFVDGLHEFHQARRDAKNALAVLNRGGFLFFHDLLPNTWEENHVPPLESGWTGDVWKIAHELADTTGITFATILADHGVGVARKDQEDYAYADRLQAMDEADFAFYLANRSNMNLIDFNTYVERFLGSKPDQPASTR